jgi:hypothetical protein
VEALGEASSHDLKGRRWLFRGNGVSAGNSRRAIVAGLVIDVLTRLGGASQVDQQPAFFLRASFLGTRVPRLLADLQLV